MMIPRVEVKVVNNSGSEEANIRCLLVNVLNADGSETDVLDLFRERVFHSKSELMEDILRQVKLSGGDLQKGNVYFIGDDVLVDDADTAKEELYKNGSLYPYDMPEEVDIGNAEFSVFEWLRKLEKNQLEINPEFQRHLVWSDKQKCRFIESVLLNIPLPPIYVNEDTSGKFIIVDGLQRTTTLRDFTASEFRLKHLEVLKNLNGKSFQDLDFKLQAKIEDKQLRIYIIKPKVPISMVYDIFNRINTGGTQLNRQEIRNCIFIGKSTRLLKELSEQDFFKEAIDFGISSKRMKDREAILRFFAFHIFDYSLDYKVDMDEFLGNTMKAINQMDDEDIELLKTEFERVMRQTLDFFGKRNFRLPTTNSKGRINIALMESVGKFFAHKEDDFLEKNKDKILQNYDRLLADQAFQESISLATGDRQRVRARFELVEEILGDV